MLRRATLTRVLEKGLGRFQISYVAAPIALIMNKVSIATLDLE